MTITSRIHHGFRPRFGVLATPSSPPTTVAAGSPAWDAPPQRGKEKERLLAAPSMRLGRCGNERSPTDQFFSPVPFSGAGPLGSSGFVASRNSRIALPTAPPRPARRLGP